LTPQAEGSGRRTLVDDSRHTQDWTVASPGKPMQTVRMEFTRAPDPNAAAPVADPEAVVRAHIHALTAGNPARLLELFSPEAQVFDVPSDADRLAGQELS
jgi:hypothetical protein